MSALRRILPRKGTWISITVAVVGVAAALPVALVTPPLSGGTIAALLMVAAFGSIALRVIHVANRKRTAPPATHPVGWVRVNTELAFDTTAVELRDRFRTFHTEGAQ